MSRNEKEIFADLESLCSSPGYPHAIAQICLASSTIKYAGELKPEDVERQYTESRFLRTEYSTLLGLMIKGELNFDYPGQEIINRYVNKSTLLLEELHQAMMAPVVQHMMGINGGNDTLEKNYSGTAMREPIFYGGEAAYIFQYRDFFPRRYEKDNDWFVRNKGFTVDEGYTVLSAILRFQNHRLTEIIVSISRKELSREAILSAFKIRVTELNELCAVGEKTIAAVLTAFESPNGNLNETFQTASDFNISNANPIIRISDDEYYLFSMYSLAEAFYDSPFYWLNGDGDYRNSALRHRGEFTEFFTVERLSSVFGPDRVFHSVNIHGEGKNILGEIDVLVKYADRLIIVQAKSKKLTIAARKGNDNCIRDDFKKAVQDSYNQGLQCAELLQSTKYTLIDHSGSAVDIPKSVSAIYVFCVVSDNYPALSHQARQFLQFTSDSVVRPPFVMDVFFLDVLTEMLTSPVTLLSYIDRRVHYHEEIDSFHELTILSYHLTQNLWVDPEYNFMSIGDSFCADLDQSMIVRREGIPGERNPRGLLTILKGTPLEPIIKQLEAIEKPWAVELALLIYKMSGNTLKDVCDKLSLISNQTLLDSRCHDASFGGSGWLAGITIHCNTYPFEVAAEKLRVHCDRRKHIARDNEWFGLCVEPGTLKIRFGVQLKFPWKHDPEYDKVIAEATRNRIPASTSRNSACPCGSGRKFKKCCMAR